MGKLNLANISTGLNKVKSIAESLSNIARFEMIPIEFIETADYNPFAENDTDESRYNLAMSIQASGLIEPLAVNKKAPDKYKLISGEHRFSAIQKYLSFKKIPCMIFEGVSDDEAQLKLYEANSYREYTAEQKLKRYQELEKLLIRMKEDGKYQGPIQKGIAVRLGVSTHQVRKYKRITESLSEEQLQKVIDGEISIDRAYQITQSSSPSTDEQDNESQIIMEKSGRASAFNNSIHPDENISFSAKRLDESRQNEKEESGRTSAFDNSFWDDKIKFAIKCHYNIKSLFIFYTFEVPTTQEAIKEKLKPCNGYEGGTVTFPDGVRGDYTCRSSQIDIEYNREHVILTYTQVDSYIRDMIRAGEWLSDKEIHDIIEKKLNKIRAKSGSTSAFKKE